MSQSRTSDGRIDPAAAAESGANESRWWHNDGAAKKYGARPERRRDTDHADDTPLAAANLGRPDAT